MQSIVLTYLNLLDTQCQLAFAALDSLTEEQIWQRPAPNEWCLGEILDHNYLLIANTLSYIKVAWNVQQRLVIKRCDRSFATGIEDPYRKPSFLMWIGFLWKPCYNPKHPLLLEKLKAENRTLHTAFRAFYADKDPVLLGNAFV